MHKRALMYDLMQRHIRRGDAEWRMNDEMEYEGHAERSRKVVGTVLERMCERSAKGIFRHYEQKYCL